MAEVRRSRPDQRVVDGNWLRVPPALLLTGPTLGLEALRPTLTLLLPALMLGILAMQYSLGALWLGLA